MVQGRGDVCDITVCILPGCLNYGGIMDEVRGKWGGMNRGGKEFPS